MQNNYRIIKEITKNNRNNAIIQKDNNEYLFRKLIIDNSDKKMILSLKNEIECLDILKDTDIVPKIIEYDLDIETPYLIIQYINLKRLDVFNFSSLKEKIQIMINILTAISKIHQKKIIHRDLKPQNIFVDEKNNVKIIDFGISSIDGRQILTNYGSLNYCSPEQIKREKITIQSDIFSLGIIFYKILIGEAPFVRCYSNLKKEIEYSKIKEIEYEELNKIFFKAISENISFRYKNVEEFRNDLVKILDKKEEKMNREKYLPVGSVVLLQNAKKRVMVTGFAARGKESGNKMFDYIGCLYPEGVITSNQNLLFNHDQIDKIFYLGYTDDEWKSLEPKLKEIVRKIETGNPVNQPGESIPKMENKPVEPGLTNNSFLAQSEDLFN